ncbi:MAG: OmpA family protein [Gemmatimonadaceae bacterium]
MPMRRRSGILLVAAIVSVACARPSELVVLLPDPESGEVGAANVRAEGGAVDLATAGAGTRVGAGRAPTAPKAIPATDVNRLFGDALASRPPAARRFVLQFEVGSELTPEARRVLDEIVREVRSRASPEVAVIGHTDRTGPADTNRRVGLQRAESVREFLMSSGISADLISVASHGESDPVVPTADDVAEPRNKRVEVTVR